MAPFPTFNDGDPLTAADLHRIGEFARDVVAAATMGLSPGFFTTEGGKQNCVFLSAGHLRITDLAVRNEYGAAFAMRELSASMPAPGRPSYLWLRRAPLRNEPEIVWLDTSTSGGPNAVLVASLDQRQWVIEAAPAQLNSIRCGDDSAMRLADLVAAARKAANATRALREYIVKFALECATSPRPQLLTTDFVLAAGEEFTRLLEESETSPAELVQSGRNFARRLRGLALRVYATEHPAAPAWADHLALGGMPLEEKLFELAHHSATDLIPTFLENLKQIELDPGKRSVSQLIHFLSERVPDLLGPNGSVHCCLAYRTASHGPFPAEPRPFPVEATLRLWKFQFGNRLLVPGAVFLRASARLNDGLTICWGGDPAGKRVIRPSVPLPDGRIDYEVGAKPEEQNSLYVLAPIWTSEQDLQLY